MDRKEFESLAPGLRDEIVRATLRIAPSGDGASMADDVAQDTLLRLWSMRERLDSYSSVKALALVIARNITIDMVRRRSGHIPFSLEGVETPDPSPLPDEAMARLENASEMDRMIARLSPAQQALIRMRHVEGMEIAEIAAVTDSSQVAIRVALSRARNRLRDLFLRDSGIL